MRVKRGVQMPLLLEGKSAGNLPRLPFPIAWHKIRRAVRREMRKLDGSGAPVLFAACRLIEGEALLDQVRSVARRKARAGVRKSKLRTAVYVCTPEGRRATRVIAVLSEQMAAQEAQLCG